MIAHVLLMLATMSTVAVPQEGSAPGRLAYTVPDGWVSRAASSNMRVAEFTLPAASSDTEPGDLVLYYFGGSGGTVEANIQRWIGQIRQPPGAAADAVRRAGREVHGLQVTTVDVSGTYVAEMRPGSAEHHDNPGYRLRAAVIETPRGPYFVKLVGPQATIERWTPAFDAFIDSVRFER
jgi:hypothetical protein